MRILLVEDEFEIRSILEKYLKNAGYEVECAKDGFEGLQKWNQGEYQFIVLDVMMPGIDGFEVLAQIRKVSEVPVLMLTAKVQEVDRLKGFDLGADDYVLKPFSPKEVLRRIAAISKRSYPTSSSTYVYKELMLDIQSQKVQRSNEIIEMTATEFAVLKVLFEHKGQVLTREQLIEHALGYDFDGYDRSMDTYIKRIRHKIEKDPKNPVYLKTKYGVGYIFGGE